MAYILKDSQGESVKHQGQEVYAHDRAGSVKVVDKAFRTLTIVGSDETKDRDGDILSVKGWQLDNFLKNPVFLYAHNYSSVPIGSALKVIKRKDPVRLEFIEKFPSEGLYPFADMIFELFNEKILNASSVGFIPKKWEPLQEKDTPESEMGYRGRRFLEHELLELSACPVPSNPNALQNSVKFMKSHTADQIALMMSGQMDLDVKKEEVLGELVKEVEFIDEEKIQSFVPVQIEKVEEEVLITVKGEMEGEKKEDPPVEAAEEKAGAVLNAKNKSRLVTAQQSIGEVLSDAGVDLEAEGDSQEDGLLKQLLEKFVEMEAELKEIKSFILSQQKSNGTENISSEQPEGSLQEEYEKLLSPGDNEEPVAEVDEDDEIIKEVVEQLKKSILKKQGE